MSSSRSLLFVVSLLALAMSASCSPQDYTFTAESKAHLLEGFDKNLAECLEHLRGLPDDKLMVTWKMVMEGKTVMEMPRIAVIKGMQINHIIHHRAQLGLYLRLNDVPVPALYGRSADEDG